MNMLSTLKKVEIIFGNVVVDYNDNAKVEITIGDMGNASFRESKTMEVSRILSKVSEDILSGGRLERKLMDTCGNSCGEIKLIKKCTKHSEITMEDLSDLVSTISKDLKNGEIPSSLRDINGNLVANINIECLFADENVIDSEMLEFEKEGNVEVVYHRDFNNKELLATLISYIEYDNATEIAATLNLGTDMKEDSEEFDLIQAKLSELIKEHVSINTIYHVNLIQDTFYKILKDITSYSGRIEEEKAKILRTLGDKINDSLNLTMDKNSDGSIDLIIDNEENKIYACYCSKNNSYAVSEKYSYSFFTYEELEDFAYDYNIALA